MQLLYENPFNFWLTFKSHPNLDSSHKESKYESIDPEYLKTMARFFPLQCTTSTFENYRIALNFAKTNDPKKHRVLFVILIHNFMRGFAF